MSVFAAVRSFGCFVYFDEKIPARALIDAIGDGFGVANELKISTTTKPHWRNFSSKYVDEAIADPATLSSSFLVGTPQDVRLGAAVTLREDSMFPEFQAPALMWIGAECGRWPEPQFTRVARELLTIAATQGVPVSGGVLAAADLRNAKVEMTMVGEGFFGDEADKAYTAFREKVMRERAPDHARTKLRRAYPTTLLGPTLASQVDAGKLAAAGAQNIESINGSIIFDATPQLLEAWSPEYLAATTELRRLLWPLSFQNPYDDPDPPRKGRR